MNTHLFAPVIFGLAASLCWGSGDFSGGLTSRRANAGSVALTGYAVGLVHSACSTVALLTDQRSSRDTIRQFDHRSTTRRAGNYRCSIWCTKPAGLRIRSALRLKWWGFRGSAHSTGAAATIMEQRNAAQKSCREVREMDVCGWCAWLCSVFRKDLWVRSRKQFGSGGRAQLR
jgi:hypothetical protein